MKRPRLNITTQDIAEVEIDFDKEIVAKLRGLRPLENVHSLACHQAHALRNRAKNKYGYYGICPKKCRRFNLWRVTMKYKGKTIHIGNYRTKEEAARAYDKAAKAIYGELAILNFPDE